MSGGGGQSSTTTTGIPDEYKGLASEYASRSADLSHQAYTPYTGTRFAGTNQDQSLGYGLARNNALGTAGLSGTSNQTLQDLQGGGTNPYLDQMVNKAQANIVGNYNNVIRPQQDQIAARSGSFGNSGVAATTEMQQKALGNQLGDVATSIYGGAYDADQNRRLQAANSGAGVSNQALQTVLGTGGQQQAQQQQGLDFNYQQFQDALNQPYRNLQTLGSPLQGNLLGQVQRTQGGGK